MAKKMLSSLLKPTLSLFLICLFTTLALAFVNAVASPKIAERNQADQIAAQKNVMPGQYTFKKLDKLPAYQSKDDPHMLQQVYEAQKDGKPSGYVFALAPSGYGGDVNLMVGVSSEHKITGLRVLAANETPGLGAKSSLPAFYEQYTGKGGDGKPLAVVKANQKTGSPDEIDAITAATITSRAVTRGAQAALDISAELAKGGK